MTSRRVAFAGFIHETNTFAPTKATYDAFLKGSGHLPLCRGEEMIALVRGANTGIEGALDYARQANWEVVPILRASAVPSAHVTEDAFERIAGEIVAGIVAALPVDGIYLDLHGAMVCEHLDDGEGELLARIKSAVGHDIPVAVSLDLHGNITRRSVDDADVMIGYRTYPHVDMALTGKRAAGLLDRLMDGERFAKSYCQIDYLIPISWQCTEMEPAQSIYARLAGLEEEKTIVSLSFFPGFPAADFNDCGATVLSYGTTQEAADLAADGRGIARHVGTLRLAEADEGRAGRERVDERHVGRGIGAVVGDPHDVGEQAAGRPRIGRVGVVHQNVGGLRERSARHRGVQRERQQPVAEGATGPCARAPPFLSRISVHP